MAFSEYPDFQLQREVELPQIRARALEFKHEPTGLRLMHLATDDPENCFALAFATPPAASNGVPHILEHAVLAGSEKFPVREPFFELIKSSPAGFINAMTSDVWTIYPIATTLAPDFWNLAEVYADAVFHPQLTRDTFEREGHHLELAEPGNIESPLVRSGIVYNEMKGAYSNTEMVIGWRLKNKLFPGGALGVDSGGDPQHIPSLSWEGLTDFYRQFYAAGNCFLLVYGDIPTEQHLAFWSEKLKDAPPMPSLAERPTFEQWNEPHRIEETFGIEPGADASGQTFLSLRWRCGDGLDKFQETSWDVLSRLLSGHDGAPLKKALVASKLGADVMAANVEGVESELTFHIALKGSEPERADEFESFVMRTLESIADAGFGKEEIGTALRQAAYETLEVPSLFPLHLAMDAARYATCGADPLDVTRSREMLDKVRAQTEQDDTFFSRLIREGLIENPHRLLTVFRPDETQAAREEAREKGELAAIKSVLDEVTLREIDARAAELEAAQNEPNSPAALATLPRLAKGDLPDAPREIPTSVAQIAGFTVLRNDVFSNGVVYLRAAVDVRDLPPHLWKWLPLWAEAFEKMGAGDQGWATVAARRAKFTGSLAAGPRAVVKARGGAPVVDIEVSLKTLDDDVDGALDLVGDLLWNLDARDRERLLEVGTQSVAGLRDDLVNNAMSSVQIASAQSVSPVGWLAYLWHSPLALKWMRDLTGDFAARADEIISGIESVRDFLLQRERWTWSYTGGNAAFTRFESRLHEWGGRMKSQTLPGALEPTPGHSAFDGAQTLPRVLGLAAPLDVQFCAQSFPAPPGETKALVDLGLALLRFDYFLPEIRLKGNAYGGGGSLRAEAGVTTFFSYRDPRLSETLRVFEGAREWVVAQSWTDDDLERALLGNVSDAVPAIRPAASTATALHRFRRGETAAMRAENYARKLAARATEVQNALTEYLDAEMPNSNIAVAASRLALEKANATRTENGKEALEIREMV